jgi:hypothetical protein
MNGFELAYPSRKHPRLVEPDHANVTGEFLQTVLDHANTIGLDVVAGLSTTGHCDRALQEYPELAGVHADGRRWQCAMCHNHPGARDYVRDLLDEVHGPVSLDSRGSFCIRRKWANIATAPAVP